MDEARTMNSQRQPGPSRREERRLSAVRRLLAKAARTGLSGDELARAQRLVREAETAHGKRGWRRNGEMLDAAVVALRGWIA